MSEHRNKYGAQKVRRGAVKFDSKLERTMYDLLLKFKIPFFFQRETVLQPPFVNKQGKKIRAIKIIIDFVIEHNGELLIVDTKGYATPVAVLKYKMFDYLWHNKPRTYRIIWLSKRKEVQDFVIGIHAERQAATKKINNVPTREAKT